MEGALRRGLFSAAAETGARGFGGGGEGLGDADWVGGCGFIWGGVERGFFQPRERVWWRLCVRVEGLVRFRLDWHGGVRVFWMGVIFRGAGAWLVGVWRAGLAFAGVREVLS